MNNKTTMGMFYDLEKPRGDWSICFSMNRRNAITRAAGLLVVILATSTTMAADPLAENFAKPTREVGSGLYMNWNQGLVTREGLAAEYRAYAEKGLWRVTVDDRQSAGMEKLMGPMRPTLPGYDDMVAYAAKEAAANNLKFFYHICPGYATSGGPWVKPEDAMQFITMSETVVNGPGPVGVLPQPPGKIGYRDIAVLAVPLPVASPLPSGKPLPNGVSFDQPVTARTVQLQLTDSVPPLRVECADDGATWREVARFASREYDERGFTPLAAARLPIPVTTAKCFRVVLSDTKAKSKIQGVTVLAEPTLPDYAPKAAYHFGPTTRAGAFDDGATAWFIDPTAVRDLTGHLKPDGTLDWTVPAGRWRIFRIGSAASSSGNHPATEGRGLECDKMNKDTVLRFLDAWIGKLDQHARDTVGVGLGGIHHDSWEAGLQNWTPRMREEFRARRGYDLLPWLPTLAGNIVGDVDKTERFLRDVRQTVSDLIVDHYWKTLREYSDRRSMLLSAQIYQNTIRRSQVFDPIRAGEYPHIVEDEFWGNRGIGTVADEVAHAAQVRGKPIVSAEAFTGGLDYRDTPRRLKQRVDSAFAVGVNLLSPHGTPHQPWPDARPGWVTQVWGIALHHHQSWWPLSQSWWDYVARCQHMLRQGLAVADVLYLYGESVPHPLHQRTPELPSGLKFAACSSDIVQERLTVAADGTLCLPQGQRYRFLLLPPDDTMTLATARKLRELVKAGAVIAGTKPRSIPGLSDNPARDDAELRSIADDLWGNGTDLARSVGKGKVYRVWDLQKTGALLAERMFTVNKNNYDFLPVDGLDRILAELKLAPDVEGVGKEGAEDIAYIHRAAGDVDIYFVANQSGKPQKRAFVFRQSRRAAELWDALIGQRKLATATDDGRTRIELDLPTDGSIFVVFRATSEQKPVAKQPVGEPVTIAGPWDVAFEKGVGAPETIRLEKLQSLSSHADSGVKYFSGVATYRTTFTLSTDKQAALLDLGDVRDLARVTVNGVTVGGRFCPPYSFEIPEGILRAGQNELAVEVANSWYNRLIGDEKFPSDVEYNEFRGGRLATGIPDWVTKGGKSPNGRVTFSTYLPATIKKDAKL
jgi:hypothetical protein